MKLLNNQGSPSFAPGFDKDANIWCKDCGQGDSITEIWKAHIEEHRLIESLDNYMDPPLIDTIVHDADAYIYKCSNCGHEEQDLEAIATENIFEANEAYKIYINWKEQESYNPHPLMEEDQGEEDNE